MLYNKSMYIRVSVKPEAKKEELKQVADDRFSIAVKVPAKNNAANLRVLEIIAGVFKVPKKTVRLISGHHHPHKIISIDQC